MALMRPAPPQTTSHEMTSSVTASITDGRATLGRMSRITFRALTEADLPLLSLWLAAPHVTAWWGDAPTLEEVRAEYIPRLAGEDVLPLDAPAGVVQFIACEDGTPFGFIQCYRVMAHQHEGWWLEETDPSAVGIDQLIGLGDRLGQGLGTRMLQAFVARIWEDPRVTQIQTDPSPDNARAIAAYRNAGFVEVGLVDTPDGRELLMKIGRSRISEG